MSYREKLSKLTKSDPFWGEQPEILYSGTRLVEFVPTSDMNRTEKINALARMFIYLSVVFSILYMNSNYLYFMIIGLAFLYFVHVNYPETDTEGFADCNTCGLDPNGNVHQMPTKDNPFMNVLLTDYTDRPLRPPAADVEVPAVKADMKRLFEHNLYKNVDDIWDRNNSQRQYYTNPGTTIPNDRDSFMNWCWRSPYVCKDGDLNACLKREDVRGHGQII